MLWGLVFYRQIAIVIVFSSESRVKAAATWRVCWDAPTKDVKTGPVWDAHCHIVGVQK